MIINANRFSVKIEKAGKENFEGNEEYTINGFQKNTKPNVNTKDKVKTA